MNKVVNIISILALGFYILLAFGIIYDLSVSNLFIRNLSFQNEILYTLTGIVAIVGLIRIMRRWQGIKDMKNFKSFQFKTKLNKNALQYAVMHSVLEIAFMGGGLILLLNFFNVEQNQVFPMLIILGVITAESILFLIRRLKGGDVFAAGINEEVVAFFNREMKLYYYTGLLRVEIHYGMIHFKYRGDLSMFLPTNEIPEENRAAFRDQLIETLEPKNVYIDEGFRKWE